MNRNDEIEKLKATGMTGVEIARKMGIHKQRVYDYFYKVRKQQGIVGATPKVVVMNNDKKPLVRPAKRKMNGGFHSKIVAFVGHSSEVVSAVKEYYS